MLGLVADIGSTNARFALATTQAGNGLELSRLASYPCADFPNLADAIRRFLDAIGQGARPRSACLAVAGPVRGDRIALTNHGWEFSIADLKRTFEFDHLAVINDFAAVSSSLPQLAGTDVVSIGPTSDSGRQERYAVMGPGTGLGVGS